MNHTIPSIPITSEFFTQTQVKYDALSLERSVVMKRLQTAREMGDLSENGAYKYAKFELGSIGRQLQQLKFLLDNGAIIQPPVNPNSVTFGCTVKLETQSKTISYQLVSQYESNPKEGKLSTESPIGAALMNKQIGDVVEVIIPSGTVTYSVIGIA